VNALKDEEFLQAAKQVEAFLEILESRYNLREEDIPQLIEAIRWADSHRKRVEQSTFVAASALITLSLTAWAATFWDSIVAFFKR
jgi:uncharacterized tellurite resistance protein B-like protein